MLNLRNDGCRIYQVELRRNEVGGSPAATDAPACQQLRDVVARDEDEARLLIGQRYPAADGFVIDNISMVG